LGLWDLTGVAPAAVLNGRQREPDAKRAACISEVSQKPMVSSKGCVILAHGGIYMTVKQRFSGAARVELITKITIGEA
jgi:hypothetical protein